MTQMAWSRVHGTGGMWTHFPDHLSYRFTEIRRYSNPCESGVSRINDDVGTALTARCTAHAEPAYPTRRRSVSTAPRPGVISSGRPSRRCGVSSCSPSDRTSAAWRVAARPEQRQFGRSEREVDLARVDADGGGDLTLHASARYSNACCVSGVAGTESRTSNTAHTALAFSVTVPARSPTAGVVISCATTCSLVR
jgi:hypothetical protein